MHDIFVDKVLNIRAIHGVARIDFGNVQNIDLKDKKADMRHSLTVAIPMEGLMELTDQLVRLKASIAAEVQKQQASQSVPKPEQVR